MATKLGIFNSALAELGQRELVSLTDAIESRRVLSRLWDAGLVRYCLEQGAWNFAVRAVKSTDDPPAPAVGFLYRHAKPSDWIRTVRISAYPTFIPRLDVYRDEGQYWYADYDELYIEYISSHPSYGGNMDVWPESFTRYVVLYLAAQAASRLLVFPEAQRLLRGMDGLAMRVVGALRSAKSRDASNQPTEFSPLSSWARSRQNQSWNTNTDKNG